MKIPKKALDYYNGCPNKWWSMNDNYNLACGYPTVEQQGFLNALKNHLFGCCGHVKKITPKDCKEFIEIWELKKKNRLQPNK